MFVSCPLKKIANPRESIPCDPDCALFICIHMPSMPDCDEGLCGLSSLARHAVREDVELHPEHRLLVNAVKFD